MAHQFSARDRIRMAAALAAALASAACGGGGSSPAAVSPPAPPPPPPLPDPATAPALKTVYQNDFRVGAAIAAAQTTNADAPILQKHFSSITAEYQMKADQIAPAETTRNFGPADALANFAQANAIGLRGHALVWHQTTPAWFLAGSSAQIRARLEAYVAEVVTRYAGRIYAWDVVNEVANDAPATTLAGAYRTGAWYDAVGPDYIEWAFRAARLADPNCLLFLNDYNTEQSGKRANVMRIVDDLKAKGVPIDGVGHQAHIALGQSVNAIETAIDETTARSLISHITELDISVYNDPGSCYANATGCQASYGANPPAAVFTQQAQLYRDLFQLFARKPSVTSVTTWGVHDAQSWLNNFPIARTNYPLLFDRARLPKAAFWAVADPAFVIP
jgi:endo-1,4-beta-xylanase